MARPQTVLIVDDEPSICTMLKQFFTHLGLQSRFAATGTEALALIDKKPPDLVILDIHMPGLNGVEVLRRLQSKWPSGLPFGVIILTGSSDEPLLEEALGLGAFDVLLKPVSIKHLELAVRVQLLMQTSD
jgi:two-component system response regulator AtoC